MRHRVEILPAALDDAEAAYLWWREPATARADACFDGLILAIESLAEFPGRCAVIPESDELEVKIRQLLYGSRPTRTYRILFRIRDEATVRVLRIRHGARDRVQAQDFESPDVP